MPPSIKNNQERARPWKSFCDPNMTEHQSFIAAQPLVNSVTRGGQKKYAQENDDTANTYADENEDD
jgi:hypothetical protein